MVYSSTFICTGQVVKRTNIHSTVCTGTVSSAIYKNSLPLFTQQEQLIIVSVLCVHTNFLQWYNLEEWHHLFQHLKYK